MTKIELFELLRNDENSSVEFKRDAVENHELAKEIVAFFIRAGSTSREAGREELERIFQASGRVQYGLKPVPGATPDDLDRRRLHDCFLRVLGGSGPDNAAMQEWERLLRNLDLMTVPSGQAVPTIDGMLLFGRALNRFLPQSGIRALCYPGATPDYATHADETLKGPLVPLCGTDGSISESCLVEQALDFVNRNTEPTAHLESGPRIDRPTYPATVLREAIVNALVHRDYSIAGSDIMLTIYSDRVEIQSPGRLPNTVTLEGMRAGMRYARNQTLVNVMRDRQRDARLPLCGFPGHGCSRKDYPRYAGP